MFVSPRNHLTGRPRVEPVSSADGAANRKHEAPRARGPRPTPPGQGLPVPVAPAPSGATSGHGHSIASAPLLAQLIAARLDVPQSRQLRRASPCEAGRAYQSGEALRRPARAGQGTMKV